MARDCLASVATATGERWSCRSGEDPGKSDVTRRNSHSLSPQPASSRRSRRRPLLQPMEAPVRDSQQTGDGVLCERWMWLSTGPAAADGPAQEADTHEQVERLRFRGRLLGILPDFIPGSGSGSVRCVPAPFRRASCRTAAVQLVPPVRRRRFPDPDGQRGAVPLLQEPGTTATSRIYKTRYTVLGQILHWHVASYWMETLVAYSSLYYNMCI